MPRPFPHSILALLVMLVASAVQAEEPAFVHPRVSRCNIRIVSAKVLNQYEGKYLPIDLDPGFVLTVEFLDDCAVLDKKAGDQAPLGFHSVIETFGDAFGDITGRMYSVDVTRMTINGKLRFNICRVLSSQPIGGEADPQEEEPAP